MKKVIQTIYKEFRQNKIGHIIVILFFLEYMTVNVIPTVVQLLSQQSGYLITELVMIGFAFVVGLAIFYWIFTSYLSGKSWARILVMIYAGFVSLSMVLQAYLSYVLADNLFGTLTRYVYILSAIVFGVISIYLLDSED